MAAAAMILAVGAAPSFAASVPGAPKIKQGPSGSAFYDPPAKLPAGKAGTPIWASRIKAPKGAVAYRVLYKSTVRDGKPVAVSGLVVAPKGKAPKGGRKVVAWAHGTLGGASSCAPSIGPNPAQNLRAYYTYGSPYTLDTGVPGLAKFLKAGYVVTATDYQGLGTPGVHQYTVAGTEARNVLDSVKAAQRLKAAGAGNDTVVFGWSQGGGAAIFAGQQQASTYGKPLRVQGIAALAPAANTGPDIQGQVLPGPTTITSRSTGVVQQLNAFRGFAAGYAGLSLSDVVTPAGQTPLNALNVQCTIHLADVIQELGVDPATFFKRPIPPAWIQRFNEQTAGNQTTVAPVLTMQGTADSIVNPNGTYQYIQRACRYRQPVKLTVYQGANHQTIPAVAQNEYVPWIADRFAGRAAPSGC